MQSLSIAIVGDSSSSGIGIGKDVYPYLLYESLRRKISCQITNYAVPGMTSSDAAILYRTRIRKDKADFLVIYLGNNEFVHAPRKPYVTYRRWYLNRILTRKATAETMLALRRRKYAFVNAVPKDREISVTVDDFRENLASIVEDATKRQSRVILVNPIANARFPAGLGLENAVFMKFIDMAESVGNHLQSTDAASEKLIQGIIFQDEGLHEKMAAIYEDLASKENGMVSFVARHNLAVHLAVEDPESARARLLKLLGTYRSYDPVIHYNLALMAGRAGTCDEAEKFAKMAYESDASLYRIKNTYRRVIADIAQTYCAQSLDLANVLDNTCFIDYCHPTVEGHQRIAESMEKIIRNDSFRMAPGAAAEINSIYTNCFVSPDYYRKPGEDIVDYYRMDAPISHSRIGETFARLTKNATNDDEMAHEWLEKDASDGDSLRSCAIKFLASNKEHPIFSEDLLRSPGYLPYSHEMLSFPEFYIYRLLYNYYLIYEGMEQRHSSPAVFTSANYKSLILRHNAISLEMCVRLDAPYLLQIEEKVIGRIRCRTVFENAVNRRIKTVIYWYTREAFRYGTHSRASMLYERLEIDRLIESLIVAAVIARANSFERRQQRCHALIDCLIQLIDVHERYVGQFVLAKEFDEASYHRDLATMEERTLHQSENYELGSELEIL